MKRILTIAIIFIVMMSTTLVSAYSEDDTPNNKVINIDNISETSNLETVEVTIPIINNMGYKINSKSGLGQKKITNNLSISNSLNDNIEEIEVENNTIESALEINLNDSILDKMTEEINQRWYKIELDQKTKLTIDLFMQENSNFDLSIYKYDEDNQLIFVTGSNFEQAGIPELVKYIGETGLYYIKVDAYQGNGDFLLTTYAGINDVQEINDSLDTASSYIRNNKIIGTIDSPYDYDIYKVNVEDNQIIDYSFERPNESDYEILLYNGSDFYIIEDSGSYRLDTGTYYLIVRGNQETYKFSDKELYGLTITDYKMSNDPTAVYMWYTPDLVAIFQFNADRTAYYINGNPIDFTYSRKYSTSNGNVYTNLYEKTDQFVALFQREADFVGELPDFINYQGPFVNDECYSNALMLSIGNTELKVNSYSTEYPSLTSLRAIVVIDCETGKIVDIMEPNPLHHGIYVKWSRIKGTECNYNPDPSE